VSDPTPTAPSGHEPTVGRGNRLLAEHERTLTLMAQALRAVAAGEMVIVTGDRHLGFVGALVTVADRVTPERVNFFITEARGPVYATMDAQRLDALGLEVIRPAGANRRRPAIHVPVDYRPGTTTGLSTSDRARTIRALADPDSRPEDFRVPGHVLPIGARRAGVLERPGHTEAAVDLVRLAGLTPAAVTCSILNEAGGTASVQEIAAFADQHGLIVLQIADIAAYRRQSEDVIERVDGAVIPTPDGRFLALGYRDPHERGEHMALVMGDLEQPGPIMVRVHTECLAGDVFGFTGCRCGADLRASIEEVADHGRGVLLYIRAPGGDRERLRHLEPAMTPALEAADRKAAATAVNGIAISMLRDLGVTPGRLASEDASATQVA
jgi:3,4-dihydroxy 2-butanone 4-phosphate synthase / GTP cyclohydrolase II